VPVNELWTAKRVLDQGVHGVIFPFTTTPEKAARAAASTHYPPAGLRGSGAGAAMRTWPGTGSYYDSCDREVFTVCVIEEAAAVEQIDEIAATPGIDALFIGVSDLSFSLGLRNRQDVPEFDAAIKRIVDAAHRHGKFAGRPARTAEQARQYMDQGFLFFQSPTEIGLIEMGAKQLLGGLEGAPKAMY
jgi:2-keto-3-deoxy-L-rhamnonate aldolase RhmA